MSRHAPAKAIAAVTSNFKTDTDSVQHLKLSGRVQKNPGFSKKPNPLGFWIFLGGFGLYFFGFFLFERAVRKLIV